MNGTTTATEPRVLRELVMAKILQNIRSRFNIVILLLVLLIFSLGCEKSAESERVSLIRNGRLASITETLDINKSDSTMAVLLEREARIIESLENASAQSKDFTFLGFVYLDILHATEAEEKKAILENVADDAFSKALGLNPKGLQAVLGKNLKSNATGRLYVSRLFDKLLEVGYSPEDEGFTKGDHIDIYEKYLLIAKLYNLGRSSFAQAHSLELVNIAIRKQPNNSQGYFYKANILYAQGRPKDALKSVEHAVELAKENDRDAKVYLNLLGLLYKEVGQFEKAEEILLEAMVDKEGKPYACAYQSLGELYKQTGKMTESAKLYRQASRLYSKHPWYAFEAALASFEAGEYNNTEVFLNLALKDSDSTTFYVLKGYVYLFRQNYKMAEATFNTIKRNNPDEPGPIVGLGHLDIVNKRYTSAITRLFAVANSVVDGKLDRFTINMACLGMGWLHANRNEHDAALIYFDRVLENSSHHMLALLGKANSLVGLGQIDRADEIYEKVLDIQPGNPYALAELAVLRASEGRDEEAEKIFRQALSKDPENYTCPYEGLGILYLKQGKLKDAKKSFKKAIKINPDIEYKKYNGLAKIYIREGDIEKAKKLLQKSIKNYPYDNEARELLARIKTGTDQ